MFLQAPNNPVVIILPHIKYIYSAMSMELIMLQAYIVVKYDAICKKKLILHLPVIFINNVTPQEGISIYYMALI